MENHSGKFIFLVVLIGAVFFSRFAYPAVAPVGLAEIGSTTTGKQSVPMFVLPPISLSAGNTGNGSGVGTDTTPVVLPDGDGASIFSRVGNSAPPTTQTFSSLVADLETGTVFEDLNAGSRWPTASLTKLMTATIALDKLDPATKITITEPMFAVDPTEQTLVLGGTYTVADLLRVLLLPSSNVAAQALADFYGQSSFINEMNTRAQAWGMTSTYFDDPSGLSATDEASANDFLKLAQKIYSSYADVLTITKTPQVYITEQNSGKKVLVKSINNFVNNADFIGGKTGNTPEAGGNLLSLFNYEGRPIFVIVLGAQGGLPPSFGDTQELYTWFKGNFK